LSILAITVSVAYSILFSVVSFRKKTRAQLNYGRESRILIAALNNDVANLVPGRRSAAILSNAILIQRTSSYGRLDDQMPHKTALVVYRWFLSSDEDKIGRAHV